MNRRFFITSLGAFTLLKNRIAPAQTSLVSWQGNVRLKAQTSHGIAAAFFAGKLYLAYIGEDGHNLWLATMPAGSKTPSLDSNNQLFYSGNPVTSGQKPAIAADSKYLHMLYAVDGGIEWLYFDGKTWKSDGLPLPSAPNLPGGGHCDAISNLSFSSPTLTLVNGVLTAVVTQKYSIENNSRPPCPSNGSIAYVASIDTATSPLTAKSWSAFTEISVNYGNSILTSSPSWASNAGFDDLTLCAFNNKVALITCDGNSNLFAGYLNGSTWTAKELITTSVHPKSAGGMSAAAVGIDLYLVYRGEGGHHIFYTILNQFLDPTGDVQIRVQNASAEASAPLGFAAAGNYLALAYKGNASDNLWYSFANV